MRTWRQVPRVLVGSGLHDRRADRGGDGLGGRLLDQAEAPCARSGPQSSSMGTLEDRGRWAEALGVHRDGLVGRLSGYGDQAAQETGAKTRPR